ncbi:FHA domain-containing protein [Mycobacterium kansasii]|uniref:FHA domain-containing protein n=1 Tax=Mycobacterium kansasii TaxID=1768 RepID=UPI0012BB7474|nr:FHA domain-containing protein [Mycobacterium kansasii]
MDCPVGGACCGRVWHAAESVWTIGRSAEADVRLDNPRVSRDHAVLQPGPGLGFGQPQQQWDVCRGARLERWPLRGRCR